MVGVDSKGLIAMSVILDVFAILAVILRFVARRQLRTGYGADDWLILSAVVFTTGFAGMEIYGAATKTFGEPVMGPGIGAYGMTHQFNKALRIELISFFLSLTCMSLVRLSLAFLYRRIFPTPTFTKILNIWISVLVLYFFAFVIALFSGCRDHFADFWRAAEDYTKYCKPALPLSQAQVATNMVLDLVTIVLPMPTIWSLNLSKRRKFQVVALFAAAFLSLICSITKTWIYIEWTDGAKDENPVTTLTITCVLMYVEMQIGVMVACAPLLRRMVPRNMFSLLSDKFSFLSHKKVYRASSSETTFVPYGNGQHKSTASRVSQKKVDHPPAGEAPSDDQIWVDTIVSVESNSPKSRWERFLSSAS